MEKKFKKTAEEIFITSQESRSEREPEPSPGIPKGYRLVKEGKSERVQLLVRPSTKEALKRMASAEGVSVNELINTALEEYLERGAHGN